MRSGAVVIQPHSVAPQSNPDYRRSHRSTLDSEELRTGELEVAADYYNMAGLKYTAQAHGQEVVFLLPSRYHGTE